jgi:hypothetical protein
MRPPVKDLRHRARALKKQVAFPGSICEKQNIWPYMAVVSI